MVGKLIPSCNAASRNWSNSPLLPSDLAFFRIGTKCYPHRSVRSIPLDFSRRGKIPFTTFAGRGGSRNWRGVKDNSLIWREREVLIRRRLEKERIQNRASGDSEETPVPSEELEVVGGLNGPAQLECRAGPFAGRFFGLGQVVAERREDHGIDSVWLPSVS